MKVFALQFDIAWENKQANFKKVRSLVERCAPGPASLIVLPEMFATGFSMNVPVAAELPKGETHSFLSELAREFQVYILGGVARSDHDAPPSNDALVFSPAGKLIASYSKMRPFTPGGEADHYPAGFGIVAVRLPECMLSPFICYDLRFPELFRSAAADQHPELFAVIANFPKKRISHWLSLLRARAIENQAYVVGVNRIGSDPVCEYSGHSIIVDPQGEIVADAGEGEGWASAVLDFPSLESYRQRLPFLKDM